MAITHDALADGAAAGAGNKRQFQSLSVIAPVYNEQGNIAPLCSALTAVLDTIGLRYEIILVNDGSSDNSLAEMRTAVADCPQVTAIDLVRNYGQTAALMAGIDHASGEVIIPRGDTDVRARDRVILLATAGSVKKVEKLFAVRLEFF